MIYGYARVSTLKQVSEGDSLAAQARMISGYAMMKGLAEPIIFEEDGVSGSIAFGDRPEGARLLELIGQDDIVIVPKLDRAFRSALDALQVLNQFKEAGVILHILDLGGDVSEGMGKMMFTLAAAFAEGERDRIRQRNRESIADRRARGKWLGGIVPWGHYVGEGNQILSHPETPAAIEQMKALRDRGLSLRRIAREMRERGTVISHEQVRQMTTIN